MSAVLTRLESVWTSSTHDPVVFWENLRGAGLAIAQRTAAEHAGGLALGDTSALHLSGDPLILIADSARDLKARVELAVMIDSARAGLGSTGTVTYETSGPTETIDDVTFHLGVELAAGLTALDPHNRVLHCANVERLGQYVALVVKYADDEAVMGALFTTLGPKGTVQVPSCSTRCPRRTGPTSGRSRIRTWRGPRTRPWCCGSMR